MADSEGCICKRMEGGQRLERGASLDLFCSSTAEARDRSSGPLSALPLSVLEDSAPRKLTVNVEENLEVL